ncbi:hypothetical protein DAI22_07g017200 [Oryza sativa Japonica Group]|nr:hypothetical protein DAI22_07g017200 [Oryza sativa Japonica Group]
MSEVVVSAVISEAVSRVSTFFINKHKRKLNEEDGMERLEMARIRMEAALEISSRWPPVTDASLLRWRKKLLILPIQSTRGGPTIQRLTMLAQTPHAAKDTITMVDTRSR